jgi:hypothetical protein
MNKEQKSLQNNYSNFLKDKVNPACKVKTANYLSIRNFLNLIATYIQVQLPYDYDHVNNSFITYINEDIFLL